MDKPYNFSAPSFVYMCMCPPFACKTAHTQSSMTTTKPVKFSSGVRCQDAQSFKLNGGDLAEQT